MMEEERESLQKKTKQLASQVEELSEENQKLQVESMEWRTKALAIEQAFASFAGERAGIDIKCSIFVLSNTMCLIYSYRS